MKQELRNAAYHGPFVSLARAEFSNSGNANMNRWKTYIKGDPKRQAILEAALDWVSGGDIENYMAQHRNDDNITELQNNFNTVIDWIDSLFDYVGSEMCGQNWGSLYRSYHNNSYDKDSLNKRLVELIEDDQVTNNRGIIEYLLGGETDTKLLNVRVFDEKTKKAVYQKQTNAAQAKGVSNCPLCAQGDDNNKDRIWKYNEMDGDHVTAWSKGGATDISNCTMLCRTHNHIKGNA